MKRLSMLILLGVLFGGLVFGGVIPLIEGSGFGVGGSSAGGEPTPTDAVTEAVPTDDSNTTPTQERTTETEPASRADRAEAGIHEKVNHERFINQVPELTYSDRLADVAEAHSRDMAENGYYSHINTRGQSAEDRVREAGIDCAAGENLFRVKLTAMGPEALATEAMEKWLNTRVPRQDILGDAFTREGIGVYYGSEYIYVTRTFC